MGTTAAVVADLLDNDGHNWKTRDGRDLEDVIKEHDGRTQYALTWVSLGVLDHQIVSPGDRHDTMRYVFPDGSAIVDDGRWWGIEDPDKPFRTLSPPPDGIY